MNYTIENGKKNVVILNINFDLAEWNNAQIKAYEKTKGRFNIPGFRKGHVPKNIIDKSYGKEVFYEDAIDILFTPAYNEVLNKETSIEPIDSPSLDFKDNKENGITIICNIPVVPEVKLGAYKGLDVKKKSYTVTAKEVNAELDKLAERNSREVNVTDRACQKGDITIIDYSGSIDGVKFDGGTAEKQKLELGSGMFIPGFEEQVEGMNIGEEKDITVKFPENYGSKDLSGKDAIFHIVLHEIKVKELPEINDDFIKDAVGEETVEGYKKTLKAKLTEENEKKAERELEDEIVKKIAEKTEVEIPDVLVERQLDSLMQTFEYRLMYSGMKLEQYLQSMGITMQDFRARYKDQAKEEVKIQLVYSKLIKEEKIEATEEEAEVKIAERAKDYGKEVEEYKSTLTPEAKNRFLDEVVIDKMFKFLKDNNTASDEAKPAKKATKKAEGETEAKATKKTTKKATKAE